MVGSKALILLSLTVVLSIEAAKASKVTRCDGTLDTRSVTVSGCPTFPCTLRRGTSIRITQRFTPLHDITALTTRAQLTLSVFPMPWRVPGINGAPACRNIYFSSNGKPAGCRLKKGVEYIYMKIVPIEKSLPTTRATVTAGLQERGRDITCYLANIIII